MLRIGQFTDTFLPVADGVGRVVVAYAETLSSKGQQVTVSSPLYDTGFRGGYPYELVDPYLDERFWGGSNGCFMKPLSEEPCSWP